MIQRLTPRRRQPEAGFTLIELLVVIIILGILAAVVVFAVGGVGDKGRENAVTIDERTIRTAEEAFCAKEGRYGIGSELVAAGLLSELPIYHAVDARQIGGPCNGWSFSIDRTAAASGTASAEGGPGTFMSVSFPSNVAGGPVQALFRLPDGRVLAAAGQPVKTAVWDPATNTWTPMDNSLNHGSNALAQSVVLRDDPATPGSECSSPPTVNNCGKVMFHLTIFEPGTFPTWFLFDASAAPGAQWQGVPGPASCYSCQIFNEPSLRVVLADNPNTPGTDCGLNCGKILLVGNGGSGSAQLAPDIFDPSDSTFTSGPAYPNASIPRMSQWSPIPDGRIFVTGRDNTTGEKQSWYLNQSDLTWSSAPAPLGTKEDDPNDPVPMASTASGELLSPMYLDFDEYYAEFFNPALSTWRRAPHCQSGLQSCHLLAVMPGGRFLSAARGEFEGRYSLGSTTGAYVYNSSSDTWIRTGDFLNIQSSAIGLYLDPFQGPCSPYCGKVLVAGLGAAELYTP